jgi:transglutaminase superfamily protein
LRTLVRIAVFAVWAGVMGLLLVRSGALTPARARIVRPLPAEPRDEWHAIYAGDRKIGYSHRTRRPTTDGFEIEADTSMQLAMMGTSQTVRTRLSADTDRALVLRRFRFHLRSGTIDFAVDGVVRGGVVAIDSPTLGQQTIPLPKDVPLALSETVQDMLGVERIETGQSYRYTIIDPATAGPASISLRIGPLESVTLPSGERRAYRIDEEYQGTTFRLWMDPDGTVLKEEGPLGLTIVREIDGRTAMAGLEGGVDLAEAAAIPVGRAIESPREARRLRLRVSRAPASTTLSFPPRQRAQGDRVVIETEDPASFRSFEVPERDPRFADDLAATPFLQIGDASVQQAAREAAGSERDAERAARDILDWVHRSLVKTPTISVPNAVQVLGERRGDCNEHAVLYAALARAVGIPARIASGTVYMPPDGDGAGAFYYHAWDEVWLGEWVAVDPTFGQFPADATHVKLVEGGPEKDLGLVGLIGELRFDVEDSG